MSPPAHIRPLRLFAAVVLAVAAGGCSKRRPMVMVAYVPPAGLNAERADARVARPIGRRLRALADVARVSSIAAADEVDFYVVGTVDSGAGRLADNARAAVAAAAPDLPPGGRLGSVGFLSAEKPIPDADPGTAPAYALTVNAGRAAAAGVTVREVEAAFDRAAPPGRPAIADRLPSLAATPVPAAGGHHVHLGDVATIQIEQQPLSIRHDY